MHRLTSVVCIDALSRAQLEVMLGQQRRDRSPSPPPASMSRGTSPLPSPVPSRGGSPSIAMRSPSTGGPSPLTLPARTTTSPLARGGDPQPISSSQDASALVALASAVAALEGDNTLLRAQLNQTGQAERSMVSALREEVEALRREGDRWRVTAEEVQGRCRALEGEIEAARGAGVLQRREAEEAAAEYSQELE